MLKTSKLELNDYFNIKINIRFMYLFIIENIQSKCKLLIEIFLKLN